MTETEIVKRTLLLVNQIPGVRAWRQNTGSGYGADALRQLAQGSRPRLVAFGVPGAADITGIGPHGVRIEIEVKRPDSRYGETDAQKRYARMVKTFGGIALLVRGAEEAREQLAKELESRERDRENFRFADQGVLRKSRPSTKVASRKAGPLLVPDTRQGYPRFLQRQHRDGPMHMLFLRIPGRHSRPGTGAHWAGPGRGYAFGRGARGTE